ncbi:MAG TPA: ATP-binding protein [Ktedonobacteraceae bacterium]|nr:ATP-binding protein [Ktedonobacteraceae bacterium]
MSWRNQVWSQVYRDKSRLSQEAGAAMFQGLRIRLTLWYCGVLAVALILFGVALYFGTQYFLLMPIASDAAGHALMHQNEWYTDSTSQACPALGQLIPFGGPPGQGFQRPEQVACFDQNGNLLAGQYTTIFPSAFLNNSLAKTALQTGQPAHDIVDAGGTTGQIYRYALVVPNQSGNGNLGVVLIGESVQAQESALSLLLKLLLGIGGVALLGAGVGGLFLANRALDPARLAWSNQQRFIADASHELRTPLTLLRADAEVLLRGRDRLNAEDAALLEDIVVEANRMARLSNNLLTLARLDNTSLHREHEVVNLVDLAQREARRVQALADQKSITLRVEDIGTPFVIGDPLLLEQAVLVLLDNAIKYSYSGGQIIVRTRVKDEQAFLEVSDNGAGMGPEHLPHLGERFYRVDKARSREAGGTGLGLSIARSIALTHGGSLTFSSAPGQGTTVTLALPLAYETLSDDRVEEESVRIKSLPDQTFYTG